MIDPIIGIPTPFKDERSLKRPIIEMAYMEVDVTTKKPTVSNQDNEIVTLDDDEEEYINQIQGFPIEEESSHSKEVSHSISHPVSHSISHFVSNSEITISQVVLTEQHSKPIMDVQQYIFHQRESSLYYSKQDMVKKVYEERNLSTEENFKLMWELRKNTFTKTSLLTVR